MAVPSRGGGVQTTGRVARSTRSRWRSVATAVAAFLLLVLAWELVKVVVPDAGVTIGDTRVLPRTSDAAMPHVWTVLGRLADPEVVGAAQQRSVGAFCWRSSCSAPAWSSARCCPTSWPPRPCP
jgi:hypothetical protein